MPAQSITTLKLDSQVPTAEPRFAFGENWWRFLHCLDEERIAEAQKSLCEMLEVADLDGKTFLDIGCGSGLFSLAAVRLRAAKVHSFDYDPQSVACAQELKRRYFPGEDRWTIEQGSVLDSAYLSRLGQFDVVYSWGVLHHTGHMWNALANVIPLVPPRGTLFMAVYNDEGLQSRLWKKVKRIYSRWRVSRPFIVLAFLPYWFIKGLVVDLVFWRKNPLARYGRSQQARGMDYFTNLLDWLGGYPFEVAKPEEIFAFYKKRGFELVNLRAEGRGHGNNQYVFVQRALADSSCSCADSAVGIQPCEPIR